MSVSLTLVLDPDVAAARKLHAELTAGGFPAIATFSPTGALEVLARFTVDVVVATLDVTRAGDLGFLEELRRKSPRTWIIVASARGGERARETVFQHGGDALLSPLPCMLEGLMPSLAAFTARSRPLL